MCIAIGWKQMHWLVSWEEPPLAMKSEKSPHLKLPGWEAGVRRNDMKRSESREIAFTLIFERSFKDETIDEIIVQAVVGR